MKGSPELGDFSKSIKKSLARVFGRGDLEQVLGEDWEFAESQAIPTEDLPAPPAPAGSPGIRSDGPTDLKALVTDPPPAESAPSPSPESGPPASSLGQAADPEKVPPVQESTEAKPQLPESTVAPFAAATTAPGSAESRSFGATFGTLELPPDKPEADRSPLSRAVKMLTDDGPLPESESFIRALGFGGADAPYPADLMALDDAHDHDEDAPEPMNTLDITGIFDDFLAEDDDPFEGLHGPTVLHVTDAAPSLEEPPEPPGVDESPEDEKEARLDTPAVAIKLDTPSPPPAAEISALDTPPPQVEDSLTPFSVDNLPLDEFGHSLSDSADLEMNPASPVVDSGLIEDAAPSILQSTMSETGTDLNTPQQTVAPEEQAIAPGEEDSARVLSHRGKNLWKNQRARGSSREGKPPKDLWNEQSTRASIAAGLKRDAERSKDGSFREVLLHLSDGIESQTIDLPPFPSSARRLLGRVSEEEVVEIIRSSPSLAGNVVKVANSPYYMSAKPVTSLNAAFMRIGLDQSRRVSLASLVGSSYEVEGFQRIMSRIQLHSIATASAAEMIATSARMPKEEAFLGGLLHDVGMVFTYRLMKDSIEATGDQWVVSQGTLRRMARKYHQRLGALFLNGWDLAGSVATMIAFHHHPDEAQEEFQAHAKCIHVADALAERAVTHSKSPKWKRSIAIHNPDATEEERSRAADIDGVNDISVHDLLFQAPSSLDIAGMHGIIRSVLLKLDSRRAEGDDDGKDEDASATSSGT